MGKWQIDASIDAMLDDIATCTRQVACTDQPTDFADIANVDLADIALTAGDGNGDFTIANGDTSGRKLTTAAQADVDIDTSGTATHVSLDDGSALRYVTTCTSQALTDTGTVTFPAWKIEVADAA